MTKTTARRTQDRQRRGCLAVVALFFLGCFLVLYFGEAGRFKRHFEAISPGMTIEEVREEFGRKEDAECAFRSWHVVYFLSDATSYFYQAQKTLSYPDAWPERVSRKDEIPSIYGAAQFLVGEDGMVAACAWKGKSLVVKTSSGEVKGSEISILDDRYFLPPR